MNNWLLNNGINWNIEQQNVLKARPNLIVTGCAGSGKTLLAIHLAIKLSSAGFSIGLIVYTKALRTYITHSLRLLKPNNSIKVFFERQWFYNQVEFDYIILDEFQDFSLNDITEIRNYSKEGIYLFGDIEQTLYEKNLDNEKTISIKELNTLENFNKIKLLNNFRIPKHVANLANSVTYNDNNKKSLLVNKELSFLLPEIIRFENQVLEQTWLLEFLKNNMKFKNIGILFNKNEQGGIVHFDEAIFPDANREIIPSIKNVFNYLIENGISNIGYKYKTEDNLKFDSDYNINLLTIHSAKGLEFDCVILPFCKSSNVYLHANQIYVALTRCKEHLIITYSGLILREYSKISKGLVDGEIRSTPF